MRGTSFQLLGTSALAALLAASLAGCDANQQPPPPADAQPARPTNAGSLSDAMRRAPARVLRERGGVHPSPSPALAMGPSPSEKLDDQTRAVVDEYLASLARVNTTLASLTDPALAEDALERLAPMVDQWRATMDYISMTPASVVAEIRRDYGPRLEDSARGLERNLQALQDRPAYAPICTLLRDVPVLKGRETTPPPPPAHAAAGGPGDGPR